MSQNKKIWEEEFVEFLARIYILIPWKKIHTTSPHDVFNHRVRSAARRGNLYQFTSKLCNYFGLQSIPTSTQKLLDELRGYEDEILYTLSTEHIPFCVRCFIKAKELKTKEIDKKIE